MKIEDKLNLSEDRGQIPKIEDSPLKNQADGQPSYGTLSLHLNIIFIICMWLLLKSSWQENNTNSRIIQKK